MANKFTKEQYQEIVDISEFWAHNREEKTKAVMSYVWDNGLVKTQDEEPLDIALAFSNPVTRNKAYYKYVEKEKKYYWTGKKEDENGLRRRLYKKSGSSSVRDYFDNEFFNESDDEKITESEIREWGYTPEAFEKVEVN